MRKRIYSAAALSAFILTQQVATPVQAQTPAQPQAPAVGVAAITTPKTEFGFEIGDDYNLINYTQLTSYWRKLASQSDRMKLTSIGKTAEGRDQLMAIVSSPENLRNIDKYKDMAGRLARAEGLSEAQAKALASEGKAVVWIDGGLHSTETVGAQQLTQQLYLSLTENDAEFRRILDNVIILYVPANPDGMELVSNWYMRNADPTKREMRIPRLYQKYVGHDNNRDFYMSNLPESINVNRVAYREWFPQIMFNHHQSAPAGMVVFMPTFRDPFNFNLDPLAITGLDGVGAAMHNRLIGEGKAGTGRRSTAPYSNWTSGTLRSTSLFHNSIGILTEIIGNPTPDYLPLIPSTQLPRNDEPLPIAPQPWRFRTSIDYSMSMNRAVLNYAATNKEEILFSVYKMGKNGIDKGSRDSWTITPRKVAALEAAMKAAPPYREPNRPGLSADPALYKSILQKPEDRDPRGYIIPSDQADLPTATQFMNVLIKGGAEVLKARESFTVAGKTYPAGSYVVKTAQAYRPFVLDNFEPQDHPNDLAYPGGPPLPPYDVAGYTVAYQMGVKFDRVLDSFDGPFEKISDVIALTPGAVKGSGSAGFLISHEVNNAFVLQNRLLKARKPIFWLKDDISVEGRTFGPGTIWVPAGAGVRQILEQAAREKGVDVYAVATRPTGDRIAIKPVRVGLVDVYGGNMPSGWLRWIFENYEVPFDVVYPQELDAGKLKSKYDVLVFADDVVPTTDARPTQLAAADIPAEYRARLGHITDDKTIPQVDAFAKAGGTVVAIGDSTVLASKLKLPVENILIEGGKAVPRDKLYIPGAIMTNVVDVSDPLAYGLPETVNVYYYNSPSFRIAPGAKGVRAVSSFPSGNTLRSGWALGQERLDKSASILDVDLGRGKVFLMGPEVAQRAQAHGTYKFLFNSLYYGPAAAR